MRILITGGLGYIGGRVTDFLVNKGHEITVTTTRKKPILAHQFNKVNIQQINILDKKRLLDVCNSIDYIIHLASANEIASEQNPHNALRVTTEGTLNLLEAAYERGVTKFMYFSTFHVYGVNTGKKITEEQLPNPIHPYSITHYMAELFVNQYRYTNGFETIIIRLSNGYGAPVTTDVDRWTLVVNDLCYQAVKFGYLQLKSSGSQHRDFIPIHDVLQAVHLLMTTSYDKLGNGIFNVGSGYSISIKEMCERINKVYNKHYGKKLPIHFADHIRDEDKNPIKFDISKIEKLGFKSEDNYELEILNTLKICEKKVKEESNICK